MRRYSKVAIYKLKECQNKDGQKFYEAVVVEQVYNSNRPFGNWENTFVKCNIMSDLPLEIANFDLGLDKNTLSFKNISNPEHSIIRVLDFSVENHTVWEKTTRYSKPYYHQKMTADNKPLLNQKFYILKCEYDRPDWKSEENKIAYYERRNKLNIEELEKLRKEKRALNKELATLKTKYQKLNEKYKAIKDELKQEKLAKVEIKVEDKKELKAYKILDFEDM